jgi:hypothetical protein
MFGVCEIIQASPSGPATMKWKLHGTTGAGKEPAIVRLGRLSKIFEGVLKEVCANLDPGRLYWPSSPHGGLPDDPEFIKERRHAWNVGMQRPHLLPTRKSFLAL